VTFTREQLQNDPRFKALPPEVQQKKLAEYDARQQAKAPPPEPPAAAPAAEPARPGLPPNRRWIDQIPGEERDALGKLMLDTPEADRERVLDSYQRRKMLHGEVLADKAGNIQTREAVPYGEEETGWPAMKRGAGLLVGDIKEKFEGAGKAAGGLAEQGLERIGVPEKVAKPVAEYGVEMPIGSAYLAGPVAGLKLAKRIPGAGKVLERVVDYGRGVPGLRGAAKRTIGAAAQGAAIEPGVAALERSGIGKPTTAADLAEDAERGATGFGMGHAVAGEALPVVVRGAARAARGVARGVGKAPEFGRRADAVLDRLIGPRREAQEPARMASATDPTAEVAAGAAIVRNAEASTPAMGPEALGKNQPAAGPTEGQTARAGAAADTAVRSPVELPPVVGRDTWRDPNPSLGGLEAPRPGRPGLPGIDQPAAPAESPRPADSFLAQRRSALTGPELPMTPVPGSRTWLQKRRAEVARETALVPVPEPGLPAVVPGGRPAPPPTLDGLVQDLANTRRRQAAEKLGKAAEGARGRDVRQMPPDFGAEPAAGPPAPLSMEQQMTRAELNPRPGLPAPGQPPPGAPVPVPSAAAPAPPPAAPAAGPPPSVPEPSLPLGPPRPPVAGGEAPSPRPSPQADSASGGDLQASLFATPKHREVWAGLRQQGLTDPELAKAMREALRRKPTPQEVRQARSILEIPSPEALAQRARDIEREWPPPPVKPTAPEKPTPIPGSAPVGAAPRAGQVEVPQAQAPPTPPPGPRLDYFKGDQIERTGVVTPDGFEEIIYREGPKAGLRGVMKTDVERASDMARNKANYEELQAGFRRLREPASAPAPAGYGRVGTVRGEQGTKVKGRYVLRELDTVRSSHDHLGNPREGYPQEMQPRDRDRVASTAQIAKIAGDLDPELLAENPLASSGRPLLTPDGVVVSGNGRTEGIRLNYARGDERGYKAWLEEHAEEFGLAPDQVRAMKQPVLAMELPPGLDYPRVAKEFNASAVAQPSPAERAKGDRASLTADTLDLLRTGEAGAVNYTSGENRDFARRFLQELPPSEQGQLLDATGSLNKEGATRLRNAVFARAYHTGNKPTDALIDRMSEATDDAAKSLTNVLDRAAPRMAKTRAAIEAGRVHDRDLAPELAEAISTVANLRERGVRLDEYLKTPDVFRSPVTTRILEEIRDAGRKTTQLDTKLNRYLDEVERLGDPRQAGMFGEAKLPDKKTLVDIAFSDEPTLFEGQTPSEIIANNPNAKLSGRLYGRNRGGPDPEVRARQEKLTAGAVLQAEAELRAARERGDADAVARSEAVLDVLKKGYKTGGGSTQLNAGIPLPTPEDFRNVGAIADPRVREAPTAPGDSRLKLWTRSAQFIARKHPVFAPIVDTSINALETAQRLHYWFLERKGKTAGEGGWRSVHRALKPEQETKLMSALIDGDFEERVFSPEELRSRGLDESGIAAYRQTRRLLDSALHKLVNPLRESLGLPKIEGIVGYLPHKWLGHFELYDSATNTRIFDPNIGPATYGTLAEARAAAQKLLHRGHGEVYIQPRYRDFLSELSEIDEVGALNKLLGDLEKADRIDLRRAVQETLESGKVPTGFPRHFEHRRGKEGYDIARMPEVIDAYLSQVTRYAPMRGARELIGRVMADRSLIAREDNPGLYDAMQSYLDAWQGKQTKAERWVDDLIVRTPLGTWLDPYRPTRQVLGKARNTVTNLKLGMLNVSFLPVQMSQYATHVTPIVGGKYAGRGVRAWLAPTAEEARWIQRADRLNLLNPGFVRGESAGKGTGATNLTDVSMAFASMGERWNRARTTVAVIHRIKDKGKYDRIVRFAFDGDMAKVEAFNPKDMHQVFDVVRRVNDRVHFRYDVTSRPEMIRSSIGMTAGQFKSYVTGTMELWKRFYDLKAEGKTAENLSPLALHFGAVLVLGGVAGAPLMALIDTAVHKATGGKLSLIDEAIKHLPAPVVKGVPALAQIDASRRVGQGDFIPSRARDLLPPIAATTYGLASDLLTYGPRAAAENASPTLRTILSSIDRANGRVMDRNERLAYTPDWVDFAAGTTGFRTLRESQAADEQRITRREVEYARGVKRDNLKAAVEAHQAGDDEAKREALERAAGARMPIGLTDMKREIQQRQMTAAERLIRSTPKTLRPGVIERLTPELEREQRARALRSVVEGKR
jgi:hypothetical protein